jgi:serine/threonine protein phosphatase 1
MSRTFVVGDIHGMNDKLIACLDTVSFDFNSDTLISLGDCVDRGPDSFDVVETLLKCKNLLTIVGNHDECFLDGLKGNGYGLFTQGCCETIESYIFSLGLEKEIKDKLDLRLHHLPESHQKFFLNQVKYFRLHINEPTHKEYLFVHGGFNRHYSIDYQPDETVFTWDRDLFMQALSYEAMLDKSYQFKIKDKVDNIFIGHTPTLYWGSSEPMLAANIWNLDTGCGKGKDNKLTIMNLETKEYYQH